MMPHTSPNYENQDIDFKRILRLIINNWLLIVILSLLAIACAYVYNRYTQPVYTAAGSIIVKDESSNSLGPDAVQLQGLDLFKSQKNLSTEIEIIKSRLIVERAVQKMPFPLEVSYYAKGRFKITDLYKQTPFLIKYDTLYPGVYGRNFEIKFIGNNQFEFGFEENKENKTSVHKINEKFKNKFGVFHLVANPQGQMLAEHENGYSFTIHYPTSLPGMYRGKVNVYRASESTSILVISVTDDVADRATDFVNTLINVYAAWTKDEKTKIANNTIDFINEQLVLVKDSLNLSEQNIESFKKKTGITNLSADFALQRFSSFDNRRLEIEITMKSLDSLENHITQGKDASLISTSNIGAQDPLLSSTLAELNKLELQKKNLLINSRAAHILVKQLDKKIEITRQEVVKNIYSFRDALINNLQTINSTLNKFEKKLAQIPSTERQFLGIERNRSLNENIYLLLLQQKERYGIAKAAAVADIVVLDYAEGGWQIKPKKNMAYIIGIFLSISASLSFIFIKDFLNDTIADRSQVEKLTQVPVLGTINHAHQTNGSSLVVPLKPKSAVAEAFRSIRTNLQYLSSESSSKVVVVTSTISGEGKTFFSVNMAAILAMSDKKVLLMGLDLRKPKIHEDFDVPSEAGISKILIGKASAEEVTFKTKIANLDVLPSGPVPPNPSELIMSERMKNLINELRTKYDYIIIDTPPVGLVTDALLAMQYADINIFILRQRKSKREYIETVNKLYTDNTIKNLAIVLNDLRIGSNYGGYYGGYHYGGYGYGYYDEENKKTSLISRVRNLFNRQ
ncbi:polysaccharide biosynthesis tyrosine autokinase [Rhodocytophaga aerolata]|uniref:non-specific protein-tyrosine kinase n=1 Tax=Rhodocytophaga aerolata TaxID=455078 RepID=A0ABT8R881_9BACT|nr:tyrosine-protein kinase [Rhodocytophaga aerolata]MDO1448307.1 polysaccharide biosynthesis tyrosine autokinase [Rhodocytophaga aerolata]